LIVYLEHEAFHISLTLLPYVLLILLAVTEFSDAVDGYLARKYNQVTDLGKLLDPMADSICRISVFLTFTQPPVQIPMVLVFIFLYRDSVVSTIRTICALKGFALAARSSGKIKAVVQGLTALAIVLMMIPYTMGMISLDDLQRASTLVVGVACLYTVFSGFEYIYANRHYIGKMLQPVSSQ